MAGRRQAVWLIAAGALVIGVASVLTVTRAPSSTLTVEAVSATPRPGSSPASAATTLPFDRAVSLAQQAYSGQDPFLQARVYLEPGLSRAARADIRRRLAEHPAVREVAYESPAEVREQAPFRLAKDPELLDDLVPANLVSFLVEIRVGASAEQLDSFNDHPDVDEVVPNGAFTLASDDPASATGKFVKAWRSRDWFRALRVADVHAVEVIFARRHRPPPNGAAQCETEGIFAVCTVGTGAQAHVVSQKYVAGWVVAAVVTE